jgi:hypothetical protein
VFGPIGTRGVISENVIKDVTVSVFGDFQLFSDVRPAFSIPIPFMCFGDGAGTRGAPIFQIYVEHTAQAFKKRVVQIEGQNHQVNWRKEKGDPFCPIYGFVDQYWLRRTVVIFRLTFEESKNWNRRPVLACLIRGAMVAMGLPGTISRPSAAVLRTDMPVERLFDGEGFRRTAPEILSPADFLKLNLAPGTRREDAIAQAIELTRADPRVGKDYTGLIK